MNCPICNQKIDSCKKYCSVKCSAIGQSPVLQTLPSEPSEAITASNLSGKINMPLKATRTALYKLFHKGKVFRMPARVVNAKYVWWREKRQKVVYEWV